MYELFHLILIGYRCVNVSIQCFFHMKKSTYRISCFFLVTPVASSCTFFSFSHFCFGWLQYHSASFCAYNEIYFLLRKGVDNPFFFCNVDYANYSLFESPLILYVENHVFIHKIQKLNRKYLLFSPNAQ